MIHVLVFIKFFGSAVSTCNPGCPQARKAFLRNKSGQRLCRRQCDTSSSVAIRTAASRVGDLGTYDLTNAYIIHGYSVTSTIP